MSASSSKLQEARQILIDLGMPKPQLNDRTAYCLLAILDMQPNTSWAEAKSPLIGITPIMDWVSKHYNKKYAPNSRETFRRFSMHQFLEAGAVLLNPDRPDRPVNSPRAVYQITPELFALLKKYGTGSYKSHLKKYLEKCGTLSQQYAKERDMKQVKVKLKDGETLRISPGAHSELIKKIIEDFAPRYAPGGELVYVGDTGKKFGYFDDKLLAKLGVKLDSHGKMPDVTIYFREKNWLLLIESVTSHGPVDHKRLRELASLFKKCTAGLVYVSAFPNRKTFLRYLEAIAWETEVWIADAPTHMIHFNGDRFLGPHDPA